MRSLLDILSTYEGALQDDTDEHTDETAERLESARSELMRVLQVARYWEKSQQGE